MIAIAFFHSLCINAYPIYDSSVMSFRVNVKDYYTFFFSSVRLIFFLEDFSILKEEKIFP